MSRVAKRKKFDRFDSQKEEFFEKVRDGYMAEATFSNSDKLSAQRKKYDERKGRITVVDGTKPVAKIGQEVYAIIAPLLSHMKKSVPANPSS
jgi:thymidylate kinase